MSLLVGVFRLFHKYYDNVTEFLKPCLWWILAKKQPFLAHETFLKKNTQTAEIFLETTFGFKKTATQKFETTFGFTKTTQTSISRSKSSSKSSSNEFQNLKFWCRAIWNKFQILKYAKMSIFFGIKSPVFMKILLLDPLWNLKNHEKPRFFRFVKLPYRIDQNSINSKKNLSWNHPRG